MAGSSKISMPMNLMFENIFKIDPILSGLSQIGSIKEDEIGGNIMKKEKRKLFKKNSTHSLNKYSLGTSTLPTKGFGSLNWESLGLANSELRSKSYTKTRSPLSRLWQMKRKSFSQFELELCSPHQEISPMGKAKESASIDVSGVTGFFSFLDEEHWELNNDHFEPKHIYSTLPKSRSSCTLYDNCQRVSSNSSDDYGFLRPRAKSLVESNSLIFDLDGKTGKQETEDSISDFEDEEYVNSFRSFSRSNGTLGSGFSGSKRSSNLRRRKAYYRDKKSESRSRSLTQIHNLDPHSRMNRNQDMDCKSEPGHPNDQILQVPAPAETSGGLKSPLQQSKRGKTRFFSSSAEDTSGFGAGSTNSNLSPAGPNSNSQDVAPQSSGLSLTQTPGTSTAAKKRSLLSLSSSPKYYQRQSRQATPGTISHEGSLKVKNTTKQHRWSSLFSTSVKESSKMDTLSDHLDNYEKNGVSRPDEILGDKEEFELDSLESDWRQIIDGELSNRKKQQMSAFWELIVSEAIFLRTLELLTDLFLTVLYNIQSTNILNEIDRDKIFSNLPEICKANKTLWFGCILPMVNRARTTRSPFQPSELHSGFDQFAEIFKPYAQYCWDQYAVQKYCRLHDQINPLYKIYLTWCEARPECNRERLTDIVVKPLQRLTKYNLLLRAILKYTDDLEERACLEKMIYGVEKFVLGLNGKLRIQQETERLQGIMDKMEVYDVVDTKDEELELVIKSHSRLNLFEPMPACGSANRWLVFESDMKLRDSFTSKIDVHCYLFTDMLLICKVTNRQGDKINKMKVIRQPFMVDKILLREFTKDACSFGLVYLNEYGTVVSALALHGRDNNLVKEWLENFKKAKKLYSEAREKAEHNIEFPAREGLIGDTGIELGDEENSIGLIYLPPQSPRGLSSRASQMSSLLHSHSGSIEMNEASLISSRGRSFENELRGSSLSSEEGNGNDPSSTGATGNLSSARSLSVETGPLRPPSPRHDRRRLYTSKSPSPNSLSVQIPVPNILGQSLPNLNASPPQPQSLTVPKCSLSPTHNFHISYPPPSPRGLRRSQALHPVNPPLVKSSHIGGGGSPERLPSASHNVVEIKDPIPPSNDVSPSMPPEDCFIRQSHSQACPSPITSPRKLQPRPPTTCSDKDIVQILHINPDIIGSCSSSSSSIDLPENQGMTRRHARNERLDTKRYYTAGAIEDIKKENSREKDAAIQKRLSWNHGPQAQSEQSRLAADVNKKFFSSESMSSIRSSSGVSSTSSLSYSNSDMEANGMHSCSNRGSPGSPIRQHPDVLIAVSEPDDRDQEPKQELYPSPQQKGFQASANLEDAKTLDSEDEEFDTLAYQRATGCTKIQNSPTKIQGHASVEPSVAGTSGSSNKKPKDLLNRLLTDGSLESSDV